MSFAYTVEKIMFEVWHAGKYINIYATYDSALSECRRLLLHMEFANLHCNFAVMIWDATKQLFVACVTDDANGITVHKF